MARRKSNSLSDNAKAIKRLFGQLKTDALTVQGVRAHLKIKRGMAERGLYELVDKVMVERIESGKIKTYKLLNFDVKDMAVRCAHPGFSDKSVKCPGATKNNDLPPQNDTDMALPCAYQPSKSALYYNSISSTTKSKSNSIEGENKNPSHTLQDGMPSLLPEKFVATGIKPSDKNRRVSMEDLGAYNGMAKRLEACVKSIRGYVYEDAPPTWVNDFRLIHEQDGIPIWVEVNVLNWYCAEIEKGRAGLPQCYSGKTFRKVFRWIFELYEPVPVLMPSTETVKRDMGFFADRISKRPIDPVELRDCLVRVEIWISKARKAVRKNNRGDETLATTRYLSEPLHTHSLGYSFVANYLAFILDLTEGWDLWTGTLIDFRPPQKHFMRYLNSLYRERWQTNLSPSESKWLKESR